MLKLFQLGHHINNRANYSYDENVNPPLHRIFFADRSTANEILDFIQAELKASPDAKARVEIREGKAGVRKDPTHPDRFRFGLTDDQFNALRVKILSAIEAIEALEVNSLNLNTNPSTTSISKLLTYIKNSKPDTSTKPPLYRIPFDTKESAKYWLHFVADKLKDTSVKLEISGDGGEKEEKHKAGVRSLETPLTQKPYYRFSLTAEQRDKFMQEMRPVNYFSFYAKKAKSEDTSTSLLDKKDKGKHEQVPDLFSAEKYLPTLKEFERILSKEYEPHGKFIGEIIDILTTIARTEKSKDGLASLVSIGPFLASNPVIGLLNLLQEKEEFAKPFFSSLVTKYAKEGLISVEMATSLSKFQKEAQQLIAIIPTRGTEDSLPSVRFEL